MKSNSQLRRDVAFLRKEQRRLEAEVYGLRTLQEQQDELHSREIQAWRERDRIVSKHGIVIAQLAACAHHMLSLGNLRLVDEILSTAQSAEASLLEVGSLPIGGEK